jgi:hypothetical protein
VGFPVALKLSASGVTHKTEVGGVRLGLRSEQDVLQAFDALAQNMEAPGDGVLVQAMCSVSDPVELLVAVKRDELFGPVLLVGTGGVLVESWRDARVLLPPADDAEILHALGQLRCAPFLHGGRGRQPRDLDAVVAAVQALGRLVDVLPSDVAVFEVNPLIVGGVGQGAWAVDWRVDLIQRESEDAAALKGADLGDGEAEAL